MNDHINTDAPSPAHPSDADSVDHLISAVLDDQGGETAWNSFTQHAGNRIEAWRQLAQAQYLHASLLQGFDQSIAPALDIELAANHRESGPMRRFSLWRSPAVAWAAALLLAFGWLGSSALTRPSIRNAVSISSGGESTPQRTGNDAADAHDSTSVALAHYLASPDVVAELPVRVQRIETTADGQEQITYLRQIVERRQVRLYEVATDEAMNPVLKPVGDATGLVGASMIF